MKKAANVLFILFGMLFLAAAMLVTIFREKQETSYFENRSLADFPEAEADAVLDGTYFTELEEYLTDNAAGRTTLVRWNTKVDLLLQRPVVNEVVVTAADEVLLPYHTFQVVRQSEIESKAAVLTANLSTVNAAAASYGGYFCYVAVPIQYDIYSDEYPWYLEDGSEEIELSLAALQEALDEADIPFLDLGPVYDSTGDAKEYYSTVDHHYNMYGAFTAYQSVLEFINEETGADIPILQESDVQFQEVPNYYLGSLARKLYNLIPGREKLCLAVPNEPVSFTRYNNGIQGESTVHAWIATASESVFYTYYMGGDIAETVIETDRDDLPDILIYGDSFTNAMECVLYLSCDTMYSVDLRYYEGTISDYIAEKQPDYVICLRDYESLLSTGGNGGI